MKDNNIRIKDFKVIIIFIYVLLMSSCNTDETQTVATFDNLVINEEFSTDGNLDSSLWNIETGDGTAQGIPNSIWTF